MAEIDAQKFVGLPEDLQYVGDVDDLRVRHEAQCAVRGCMHYTGAGDEQRCAAFPEGIPDEIAFGGNLHLTRFPGDRGIRFAPNGSPADVAGV